MVTIRPVATAITLSSDQAMEFGYNGEAPSAATWKGRDIVLFVSIVEQREQKIRAKLINFFTPLFIQIKFPSPTNHSLTN